MDMFRSEKTQIDQRIHEVQPKLEDLGGRGNIIIRNLHKVKNALKSPKVDGRILFGVNKSQEEVQDDVKRIKNELDVYGEKASILVGDLTVILTQIGHKTVKLWAFGAAFTGRALALYVLANATILALLWLLELSAVTCDSLPSVQSCSDELDQVTGAFMHNALLTRQLPWVDRDLFNANKTELVLYIANLETIALFARRFFNWVGASFILFVIYSLYRNRSERQFRSSLEGQFIVADDAKGVVIEWLLKHGYQSPTFLNSKYLEVEYLIESSQFAGNDARSESEYDEISDYEGDDENDEKQDETTEPDSPVPVREPSVD